jgi:hypothetical protein
MIIAEAERWPSPVVNYDQASMDEAAAAKWCGRRRLAHADMPGLARIRGAIKKAAPKKAAEQQYRRARHSTNRAWLHDFFACSDGPSCTAEYHPPLGADLITYGPDSQAFVKRSANKPSLPERGGRLLLFVALCARFLGAGRLLAGMRVLPGGDRLRLRASHLFVHAGTIGCNDLRALALALVVVHALLDPGGIVGIGNWPESRRHRNDRDGNEGDTA